MATKTATVQSGQVTGTHSNFPVYVDLADVGVTTLAEAQSIRVYSDAGLTTELAREIVSATEMHVKIPTLTGTPQIWVDYDGVRADYAVTATYGRNAVWINFLIVTHMEGDATDSTGNSTPTVTGTVTYPSESVIGKASDTSGSAANYITYNTTFAAGNTDKSFSVWYEHDQLKRQWIVDNGVDGSNFGGGFGLFHPDTSNVLYFYGYGGGWDYAFTTAPPAIGVPAHIVCSFNSTTDVNTGYRDGSSDATNSAVYSTQSGTGTLRLHSRFADEANSRLNGRIHEFRAKNSQYTADEVSTEYENINATTTFWGTWTDAGGATANNSARRMLLMQM